MTGLDEAELDRAAYSRWRNDSTSKGYVAAMMSRANLTPLERLVIVRHFYENLSYRDIARQLQAEGFVYPGRGGWYHKAIHRICRQAIIKLRAVGGRILQ